MFLALTDDERAIVEATGDFLAEEAPLSRWFVPQLDASGDEARLLELGVSMGWTGFAAPAAVGGSEASLIDEALLFRAIGRHLVPVGFVAAAMAVHIALAAGRDDLAASIVSGETGVALTGGTGGRSLLCAQGASLALRIEGDALQLIPIPPGLEATAAFDGMTTSVQVPQLAAPAVVVENGALVLRYRLLVAAQAQAIAEAALAESNAYAKMREQFGKPIGAFQAIRHKIADMELRARQAEAQLYFAAVRLHEGADDAAFQVNAALALALNAAWVNAEANVGNHGAIGVTTENSAHLLLKRALLWSHLSPPEGALLDAIAQAPAPAF